MKKFSEVRQLNEMEFGQPLLSDKEKMKDILVAACGNDQRVLNYLVNCLTDAQMKSCFEKLSKVYGYTGAQGQRVQPRP